MAQAKTNPVEEVLANGVTLEGKTYTPDDFTFAEQRKLRNAVRELAGDESISVGEADIMDFVPAVVFVIKSRDDPKFTLEDTDSLTYTDVTTGGTDRPTSGAKS
jgi:hypothetical protein